MAKANFIGLNSICLLLISLIIAAEAALQSDFRYTSLSQAFPLLADLNEPDNPRIGGQNFTRCCLKAVSQSYRIDNGNIVKGPSNFIELTPDKLSESQFPCGATYNGSSAGAPNVTIPYSWCAGNCGGWMKSSNSPLSQWIQPFIGFILPAAVFCLSVPRKRVLTIGDYLFPDPWKEISRKYHTLFKPDKTPNKESSHDRTDAFGQFVDLTTGIIAALIETVIRGTVAALIALINTVLWVAVVFCTAAPIILSGLYESAISRKVIEAVEKRATELHDEKRKEKKTGKKTEREDEAKEDEAKGDEKKMNKKSEIKTKEIEMKESEKDTDKDTKKDTKKETMETEREQRKNTERNEKTKKEMAAASRKQGLGLEQCVHLVYALLVGNLALMDSKEKPKGSDLESVEDSVKSDAWNDVLGLVKRLKADNDSLETETEKSEEQIPEEERTRVRLRSMLACQPSFGAAVGAPLVFYMGSFFFSVFENLSKVGENYTSHSLAFGMWWMTIPNVAVVCGCLLVCNNPNTLESITCAFRKKSYKKEERRESFWTVKGFKQWLDQVLLSTYFDSYYKPVWVWDIGRSQRDWIEAVEAEHQLKLELPKLRFSTTVLLILTGGALMVIPFTLAYLTSFYTPAVGLSCRSFTFLLYFVFQLVLSFLWVVELNNRYLSNLFRSRTWKKPSNDQSKKQSKKWLEWLKKLSEKLSGWARKRRTVFLIVYSGLLLLTLCGALFTTLIGTFLQLLGVYRNCLCFIPIQYWRSKDFVLPIGDNTAEQIYYAQRYWLQTGIAAIVLLVVICYFGWWYQRHWRMKLGVILDKLLDNPHHPHKPEEEVQGNELRKADQNNTGEVGQKTGETTHVDTLDSGARGIDGDGAGQEEIQPAQKPT